VTGLSFRPMLPGDVVLLSLQPSQHFELGLEHKSYTFEEGEDLAANGDAWTAYRGDRIVASAGFRELFKRGSGHAVVWAALATNIGSDHLPVTRFARKAIAEAPYRRLEAIVDAADVKAVGWAKLVGLTAVHELRGYGPEGKTHILFERVSAQ
jgi:hypothetical protein